jgi:hypothetical protein
MEATGRVIKRKCLTLETKQKYLFLGSKWSKFGEDVSLSNSWGDFLPYFA